MSASTYPVHVDARLESDLSRWQWLVKWLLVIPHYVVLAFLWAAFVVLSIAAFVAILVTGRYPRAIFEFNVGVMRWSWRVAYYAYSALGTDHYPPFTLHERPDYPTHLEVEYPEHLSRGLVLVKWWLLALPHYLIVALLTGGIGWTFQSIAGSDVDLSLNVGLISALVVVAAVVLLVTGRYPQSVFDLVLGLNRWVLRVAGYAALMTDQYPPFRLDQGGDDPRATMSEPRPAPPGPGVPPTTQEQSRRWTAGRIVSVVAGSALILMSLGVGAAAGALTFADNQLRDDGGFLMSDEVTVASGGSAIVSSNMEIHAAGAVDFLPEAFFGDAKMTATSADGTALFVGLAPTADVEDYLADVAHSTVVDFAGEPNYENVAGAATAQPPGELPIWVAQSSGSGVQEATWTVETGDWTAVVMNADGSAGVEADVTVGAEIPAVGTIVWVLVGLAVAGLVIGLVLVVVPLSLASRQ